MITKMEIEINRFLLLPLAFILIISASTVVSNPLSPMLNNQIKDSVQTSSPQPEEPLGSKPFSTSPPYTQSTPASVKPMLTWTKVPGTVYYELEILSAPPENPNDINASQYRVDSSRQVYTNGYNPDLTATTGDRLFWRVRGLDLDGNPLGVYSDVAEVYINRPSHSHAKTAVHDGFKLRRPPCAALSCIFLDTNYWSCQI